MIAEHEYSHPTIINIKSSERISGTISNFLSKPIVLPDNNYDTVCMISSNIPRTFYNVPTNSSFTLKEDTNEYTITLEAGNYTITNLKVIIKTKLNEAGTNTYDVLYKQSTEVQDFKFTFTISNTPVSQPEFIFNSSLYKVLGFNINSTNPFINNQLVSTNCVNLSRINTAYIKSNIVSNSQNSILAEILSYGSFSMLSLAYQTTENIELNSRILSEKSGGSRSYNFILVDDEDNEIDLNGIDYAFSLIIYTRSKTNDLQSKEIIIKNIERQFKILKEQETIRNETKETSDTTTEQNALSSTIEEVPELYSSIIPEYNNKGTLNVLDIDKKLI